MVIAAVGSNCRPPGQWFTGSTSVASVAASGVLWVASGARGVGCGVWGVGVGVGEGGWGGTPSVKVIGRLPGAR